MTRKQKTASDVARTLNRKHPDWSLAQLAEGCAEAGLPITRGGVANALRAKHPGQRGRPRDDAAVVARLERELAAARARAARSE